MREAWGNKLTLQRAGVFLTGPFHLPGLTLHSVKEVAEPADSGSYLALSLGIGSQQRGGLLSGSSPPFLLFPRLQKMSPGEGISAFCLLGSSWEGREEGRPKEKINSGCLERLARPRQGALWLLPLYGKAALS